MKLIESKSYKNLDSDSGILKWIMIIINCEVKSYWIYYIKNQINRKKL